MYKFIESSMKVINKIELIISHGGFFYEKEIEDWLANINLLSSMRFTPRSMKIVNSRIVNLHG